MQTSCKATRLRCDHSGCCSPHFRSVPAHPPHEHVWYEPASTQLIKNLATTTITTTNDDDDDEDDDYGDGDGDRDRDDDQHGDGDGGW